LDEAIHHALGNGDYVVQERVPTAREVFPALTADGKIQFAEQLVDLDPLLLTVKSAQPSPVCLRMSWPTLVRAAACPDFYYQQA